MGVKVRVSKKGKIIILASLVILLAGSGGYLLWRVNQDKTVSPTDSEAGGTGSYGGCSCSSSLWTYGTCDTTTGLKQVSCPGDSNCGTVVCGDSKRCQCSDGWKVFTNTGGKSCDDLCGPTNTTPPTAECTCAISSDACGTNCKFSSGTSKCQDLANSTGKSYIAMCNVSSGTVSCAEYNSSQVCWGKTGQCNNPVYNPTPTTPTTNTCDSGTWINKPSGSYAYCDAITYSAVGTDSDGILTSSISVLLNSASKTDYTLDSNSTSATISGTLSSTTSCLAAGSYTLKLSWKDSKGNTSTNCALSTTFTVQPKQTNPNWSITKTVVEACINENTPNPSSKLTYAITVRNTGDGSGTLSKIVDTLDTKVLSAYISNISNSGSYADGKLTWTLSGTDATFASNQQKVYTYVVTVPKDTFGTYANSVTAYPTTGDSFSANASIDADCTIAPQTGLFDNTWVKITVGILFILSGIYFNNINNLGRKLKIFVKDHIEDERIKKFEKKVVKR